jgi:hypothetical protein
MSELWAIRLKIWHDSHNILADKNCSIRDSLNIIVNDASQRDIRAGQNS